MSASLVALAASTLFLGRVAQRASLLEDRISREHTRRLTGNCCTELDEFSVRPLETQSEDLLRVISEGGPSRSALFVLGHGVSIPARGGRSIDVWRSTTIRAKSQHQNRTGKSVLRRLDDTVIRYYGNGMTTTKQVMEKLYVIRGRKLEEGCAIVVAPNYRVRGAWTIDVYGETRTRDDIVAGLRAWPRSLEKAREMAEILSKAINVPVAPVGAGVVPSAAFLEEAMNR